MVILISLGAFLSTFLGGLMALRFKDKLHLILGFSAGAVIGVVFFDLLPESINLAGAIFSADEVLAFSALGFVVYLILDRIISLHHYHGDNHENSEQPGRGKLGAGSLSFHSLLDGMAIGFAFQVSPAVGAVVTTAVLIHDFSDGINTVSMILKNGGDRQLAFKWLFVDALAPVVGVLITLFFKLPAVGLGVTLALFSGFFLYIGASDLLPESHHNHPTKWTTMMTVLGMAVLYIVIKLAGF
mgnify:FL=1